MDVEMLHENEITVCFAVVEEIFTCSHAKACKRIPSDVEGENLSYAAQSTLLCTSNSILK